MAPELYRPPQLRQGSRDIRALRSGRSSPSPPKSPPKYPATPPSTPPSVPEWRQCSPISPQRLNYEDIVIGKIYYLKNTAVEDSQAIKHYAAVRGNTKLPAHPVVIIDKKHDLNTGKRFVFFKTCTTNERREREGWYLVGGADIPYSSDTHLKERSWIAPGTEIWMAEADVLEVYKIRNKPVNIHIDKACLHLIDHPTIRAQMLQEAKYIYP
jgi:hypothetical protein